MRTRSKKNPAPGDPAGGATGTAGPGAGKALEQRLADLISSEREGLENLQRQQEQRRMAQKDDDARRLEALEQALGEARMEAAKREELERGHAAKHEQLEHKLGRVRIEAAKLAIELGEAQREAEEAVRTAKPRAARKIAEAEESASQARANAERERAKREELERKMEALERSVLTARAEAEHERATCAELKQKIDAFDAREASSQQAHERELAKLERARAESERTAAEAQQAIARHRAERDRERERLGAIEQLLHAATESEDVARETAPGVTGEPSQPKAEAPAPVTPTRPAGVEGPAPSAGTKSEKAPNAGKKAPDAGEQAPKAGGDGEQPSRRRRRERMFGARGRTCAVCRRTEAKSPGALKAGGWALGSEIDLCPECQEQGWQLPKGGSLPFRRSSDRDEVV